MLFSGYKSVMESAATAERMKGALAREQDIDAVLGVYAATPYPKGIWNVVWSEEFNSWLRDELQEFLLRDGDIATMLTAINDRIDQLNSQYGL